MTRKLDQNLRAAWGRRVVLTLFSTLALGACGSPDEPTGAEAKRPKATARKVLPVARAPVTERDEPSVKKKADGTVVIRVPKRMQHTTIARIGPDGELVTECGTGEKADLLHPSHRSRR